MFYQIYRISNAVYSRETPSKLPIRNAKLCAKVINESCTCKKYEGEDEDEIKSRKNNGLFLTFAKGNNSSQFPDNPNWMT